MGNAHVVLIVEDDRATREGLVQLLELEGYDSIAVGDGAAALRVLEEDRLIPCIILLDLMMPVLDGWEFRRRQLGNEAIASIPVVILTADPRAQRRAAELKAEKVLMKPLEPASLLESVARYC
jgi:CheY-like chemotaxis protein